MRILYLTDSSFVTQFHEARSWVGAMKTNLSTTTPLASSSTTSRTYSSKGFEVTAVQYTQKEYRRELVEVEARQYVPQTWQELWRGTARQALVSDGILDPPVCRGGTSWTRVVQIEVCGLLGLGFGLEDGGNVLEGLEAVVMKGVKTNTPNGLVTDRGGRLVYVPDANYYGPDSFSYMVTDCHSRSKSPEVVTLSVPPANDIPFAADVETTLAANSTIILQLWGHDVDADDLTVLSPLPPSPKLFFVC